MFKGFDRAKYDLQDPSAWKAIERDRKLHEQALALVARHLNAKPPRQNSPQIAQILLPRSQQPTLTSQVPEVLVGQYDRPNLKLARPKTF